MPSARRLRQPWRDSQRRDRELGDRISSVAVVEVADLQALHSSQLGKRRGAARSARKGLGELGIPQQIHCRVARWDRITAPVERGVHELPQVRERFWSNLRCDELPQVWQV